MKNLKRRFLSAVLLVAATTLLAACAAGRGLVTGGAAGGPIPWLDANGARLSIPAINAQRACRAGDLQFRAGAVGAHQGRVTQEVLITNTGSDACFLADPPLGTATLGDGTQRTVTAAPDTIHRLDLAPGQTAQLVTGTPAICAGVGHPAVASSLRLSLGTVQGVWVNVECGAPVVMLFEALAAAPTAGVPASRLRAVLAAPGSAARGTSLVYQVVLTNPTASAIAFDTCPSYTQWLGTPPMVVQRTLQLNCAPARTVAAGESIAFEMKITVPQTMEPGLTKLSWSLEVGGGPSSGTTIVVN